MPTTGIWNSSGCVHSVPEVSPKGGGIGLGLCVVAWSVGFFIIACNWLTISGIVREPRLRTLSNYYIASLAAADSIVGVLLLPLGISFLPKYQYLVIDSYAGCMTFLALLFASIYCSGIHMFLIAVDRYIFLTKPFVYLKYIHEHIVYGTITLSWVLSVVFGSCVFLINNYGAVRSCYAHEIINPAFSVYLSSIQHLTLAAVIAFIYGSIMHVAFQNKIRHSEAVLNAISLSTKATFSRSTRSDMANTEMNTTNNLHLLTPMSASEVASVPRTEPINSYPGVQWKAIRLFVYVFVFFVAFWLPYYICVFVNLFMCVPGALIDMSVLLGLFNSGVNFCVYAVTSRDFRAYYKRTLCRCYR